MKLAILATVIAGAAAFAPSAGSVCLFCVAVACVFVLKSGERIDHVYMLCTGELDGLHFLV